jgi:hypothetical protein
MVLGKMRVDFVVTQFVNGVPQDGYHEVRVGDGVNVVVGEKMYGDDGMANRRALGGRRRYGLFLFPNTCVRRMKICRLHPYIQVWS